MNRALKIVVLVELQDESDERLNGVVWTNLNGIPIQVEHA